MLVNLEKVALDLDTEAFGEPMEILAVIFERALRENIEDGAGEMGGQEAVLLQEQSVARSIDACC